MRFIEFLMRFYEFYSIIATFLITSKGRNNMKEEINLDIDTVRNALNTYKAVGFEDNPLKKVTIRALEELLAYKQTRLAPDQVDEMKKRHEKIELMQIEYDNICEKYDKLYGMEE